MTNQPTIMGTSYAILCLEFLGSLKMLSKLEKNETINYLMQFCCKDGVFRDPLFNSSKIATKQHDEAYFDGETTCFAQNALDALNAPPPSERLFPNKILSKKGLIDEFNSYDWRDPHLNSNRVMFWLAQFAHDAEKHKKNELLDLIDFALDWIDSNQSSKTGLWSGPYSVNLSAAMAATFHFTFFYSYRKRQLNHIERIIDSCIELQKNDGLFSRNNDIGQTCLDYDAIDLLAKATLVTDYRLEDIIKVFSTAKASLLSLNNRDGGFANVKETLIEGKRIVSQNLYHTGLEICSCLNNESNSFSTWFRLLAYTLCKQNEWKESNNYDMAFKFRRLPWLGYHNIVAIKDAYLNSKVENSRVLLKKYVRDGGLLTFILDGRLDISEAQGRFLIVLPNSKKAAILSIQLETGLSQTLQLSYISLKNKTKQWIRLQEIINPGFNTVFYLVDELRGSELLYLDVISDSWNGLIINLEANIIST